MQTHPGDALLQSPMTPSGLSCCGELHWGGHVCHLYETRSDLIDILVPFFATGLANNEKCLWVTADPLDADEASAALAEAVRDMAAYLASGQLQIVEYADWYRRMGALDAEAVLRAWLQLESEALSQGYTGLRVTGNVTFIKSRAEWNQFQEYEARVTQTFAGRRIVALCSYQIGRSNGADLLDVVKNHDFAVVRRHGEWGVIENAEIHLAKQELHKANIELEARVAARTAELSCALATVNAQKAALETALRMRDQSQAQLEAELHDARLLQQLSAALIDEDDVDGLYQKLVDAAALVMRSDFASMQRFDPARQQLHLLAHKGLNAEAEASWKWVGRGQPTSCGMALQDMARVIVPDFRAWPCGAGSADLAAFEAAGVRAAQSTPLMSRDGRLVGMISTHWTAAHAPAERDLRLLDILARQAADLIERNAAAQALRDQAQQLLDADRRKNEFLATLAHELRNPLAPIRTGVSLLKTGPKDHSARVLSIMDRQLEHMVRLIDDLMDVARISRGAVTLHLERTDLRSLVDNATEASRPLIASAGHRLTVHLPSEPVWLRVDMTRATQILSNILNNAAKYTPNGGTIELTAEVVEGCARFSIADNGVGIPPAMLDRIFDLFVQEERSLDRSKGGLGVGLALAKQLTELHGGRLTAASDGVNKGARFVIDFPIAEADNGYATAMQAPLARPTGGIRALIIDDNTDAAETVSLLLNAYGYATRVESDASAALSLAREFKPHAVLLDLGMPHVDGFELATRFRSAPDLADVTLIALSGWGSEEHRARSRKVGIDHHLTKPANLPELQRILAGIARQAVAARNPTT